MNPGFGVDLNLSGQEGERAIGPHVPLYSPTSNRSIPSGYAQSKKNIIILMLFSLGRLHRVG